MSRSWKEGKKGNVTNAKIEQQQWVIMISINIWFV